MSRKSVHSYTRPQRATYHRNFDAERVEIFTELDQIKDEALGYFESRPWHQEFPPYPKMRGPETLRNYWGYGSERAIQGYFLSRRRSVRLPRPVRSTLTPLGTRCLPWLCSFVDIESEQKTFSHIGSPIRYVR